MSYIVPVESIFLSSPSVPKASPCYWNTTVKNIGSLSFAIGFSAAGGLLAGYLPTPQGITAGSALGGIGNGGSTKFSWIEKKDELVKLRILIDFPKLALKTREMDDKLSHVVKYITLIFKETLVQDPASKLDELLTKLESSNNNFFWATRARRNFIRLAVAGCVSTGGTWLSGFQPNFWGIMVGSLLGGVGNGLSTYLMFEKELDELLNIRATKDLPKLIEMANKCDGKIASLIELIESIDPKILISCPIVASEENTQPTEESCCTENKKRLARNITYVNIAGWVSFGGSLLAGFYPTPGWIVVGGVLTGGANSVSTWLAWQREHQQEMERLIEEEFPKVASKLVTIHSTILAVNLFMEEKGKCKLFEKCSSSENS